jgi:hypothetical protein
VSTEPIAIHAPNSDSDTCDERVVGEGLRMSRVVATLQLLLATRRAARNTQFVQVLGEAA